MSAYVVSKTHIDAMVTAGIRLRRPDRPLSWWVASDGKRNTLDYLTAERVGAMLWAENVASFNHRYSEEEWEEVYQFELLPGTPDPVAVLKAVQCYEYQSCEHGEWRDSEAKAFCEALTHAAIKALRGYDAAAWEINSRDAFTGHAATSQGR